MVAAWLTTQEVLPSRDLLFFPPGKCEDDGISWKVATPHEMVVDGSEMVHILGGQGRIGRLQPLIAAQRNICAVAKAGADCCRGLEVDRWRWLFSRSRSEVAPTTRVGCTCRASWLGVMHSHRVRYAKTAFIGVIDPPAQIEIFQCRPFLNFLDQGAVLDTFIFVGIDIPAVFTGRCDHGVLLGPKLSSG